MCGICGYIRKKYISREELNKMNDTMSHRGPDDYGIRQWSQGEYEIGMAHRRLSIMDLSVAGHQPMISASGDTIITFNGEIYNFIELREELKQKGHSFVSNCDTEVVLAAYEQWKYDCFEKFNGMFAIAIYDRKENNLVIARDKLGKKPLYYYYKENEIIYASELKPIQVCPCVDLTMDYNAIGKYLSNKYIEAPDTIYKYVKKVEPGQYIIFKEGKLNLIKYWDLIEKYNKTRNDNGIYLKNLDRAKSELRELLEDSIAKRIISDVPLGSFLSGGIDSALVTAIAQSKSSKPMDTFTIGFYDKERNEAPQAKEIARYLGTNHRELYVSKEELLRVVEDIPYYYDEPFADSSQIPSMLVSEMASKNVTVALSGDGGDEVFCGYKMYDLTWIANKIDFLGEMENRMPWNEFFIKHCSPELRAFILNRGENKHTQSQFFSDVRIEEARKLLSRDIVGARYESERLIKESDWQRRRMILDMVTYLPDEILQKMDRASMRSSLEVRCPLLDHRIVEWSFSVNHSLKYHRGEKKYLLKQLAYDYIPKELLEGPKKGFGVPLAKWLRKELKDELMSFSSEEYLKRQGIFEPKAVSSLIEKQAISSKVMYSSVLWSFYVFQKWYEVYAK